MNNNLNLKYVNIIDRGNEGLWVDYNINKKIDNEALFNEINSICSQSSTDVLFTLPKSLYKSFCSKLKPVVQGYYLEKSLEVRISKPIFCEMKIIPISKKELKAISSLLIAEYGYIDRNNYTTRELLKVFSNFYGKYLDDISGIIKIEQSIVGVVICIERDGAPYILHLAVSKKYRGQSLGKALIEFSEYNSKKMGYKKIWFFVNKDNTNTLRIFRKNNYEVIGEEKLIYKISCILKTKE